jgi:DNA-binding transcriptional regulator YdaS (Cro superfamily)
MDALQRAIENLGSQAALARMLGVVPMAVSNWKLRGQVPADKCLAIERATLGAVTKEQLRPDVFGDPPGGVAA